MDIPVFFDAPGLAVLSGCTARRADDRRARRRCSSCSRSRRPRCCCSSASRRARSPCPSPSVAAGARPRLERVRRDQLRAVVAQGRERAARQHAAAARLGRPRRPARRRRSTTSGSRSTTRATSSSSSSGTGRLQHVWSTDGTAPGPGPTVVPRARRRPTDGSSPPPASSTWSPTPASSPVGRVLERKVHRGGRGARTWTLRPDRAAVAPAPVDRGHLSRRLGQADHGAQPVLVLGTARRASSRCTSSGPARRSAIPRRSG